MPVQEFSNSPSSQFVFEHLRSIADTVRKMILQRQVKKTADLVLTMEALRILGVTAEAIATALGTSPDMVRRWSKSESLPDASLYQEYAEKAYSVFVSQGVLLSGLFLNPTTGEQIFQIEP